MTQLEAAEILGVTPQFVSKWVLGKSGLSVSTATRWAALLSVDFNLLMMAKKDPAYRRKLIKVERGKRARNH